MQQAERERKTERKILIFALLGCLISLPFVFESVYLSIFPQAVSTEGVFFAKVEDIESDVRLKRSGLFAWNEALVETSINLGDTMFVGEGSSGQIQTKDNTVMIFGANTLVHFTSLNGFDVPEIQSGNVRFLVKGPTKIAIGGDLLEITGSGAEVQLYFDADGKPQFRTLHGDMAVNKIGTGIIASTRPLPDPPPVELIFANETYQLRWQDLYTLEPGRRLKVKPPEAMTIHTRQALNLNRMPKNEAYELQISPDEAFAEPLTSTLIGGSTQTIPDAFIGHNFVRVKNSAKKVFAVGKFTVLSTTYPAATLVRDARFDRSSQTLALDLESDQPAQAFIVEFSKNPVFDKDDEKRIIPVEELKSIPYQGHGRLWIRVQAVLAKDLVTDFSLGHALMTTPLETLGAPLLTLNSEKATTFENFQITWTPVDGADSYEVEWMNAGGGVESFLTTLTQHNFKPSKSGYASVRVRAIRGKRPGRYSETASVLVTGSLPHLAKPAFEKPARVDVATSSNRLRAPSLPLYDGRNRFYDSNQVAVEPGGFVAISSNQNNRAQEEIMATILTVRVNHWIQNWGVDAMARMQVFGLTEAAQRSQAQDIDARLMYRLNFEPLKIRSYFPVASLALGFESYRNSGVEFYTPGYDLVKAGVRINFPAWRQWSAGGEVFYGVASDQSNKTEISGNFGYFFSEKISAGLGYRFSLFEAKSAATSPGPLPYREAYGEGYSILRFHY